MDKTIEEKEKEIVHEFSLLADWQDKYEHIIAKGRELPPLESRYKTEEYKVRGCQSDVWIMAYFRDGRVYFKADSDALIVKGLAGMLIQILSGQAPDDILNASMDFMDEIGMRQHLSPSRSNGLLYMLTRMKSYAMAFRPMSFS